ncbi:MAG: AbrB/MazE/SpoVT family DNA-binding domain-containing protein [bacterium]|nr:AbrB/MazE/SpoVT family DNA-binding domain-containing protein [bacterium]MBK7190341.1 AbrB/MazE/SpoVT family DNA-binding domain-containing protein [bacterium]MBK9471855.1 AbrB/MazE/SpoVT family DNA-binding domain-containing protein [bacterium]
MRTKVLKWGNSLGLRIPKAFAEDIRVADGTPVEMTMVDGQLIVRVAEDREWSLDGLLAGVRPDNLHAEVDTGGPVGGESW